MSHFSAPPPADVQVSFRSVTHRIDPHMLDVDALKTLRRLRKFGHEAYLVGGCVRDILMGHQPTDFDIVTSAKPAEIRSAFRNSRIIGRRFRLAHLHFANGKIIEVATFRRSHCETDDLSGRHAAENLFGAAAEDAIRRGFTISALLYCAENNCIFDWSSGMSDVSARCLRTIGHPERRIPEDPARILRAVKFAVRLDLRFDPPLAEAMQRHADKLLLCSPARLIEELFKILRSGHAVECLYMLQEIGALRHLLPALDDFISAQSHSDNAWRALARADEQNVAGDTLSDAVLLAALLYPACRDVLHTARDVSRELESVLRPLVHPLPFTRHHMASVRQMFLALRRLSAGPAAKRARKMLERDFAADAIDLLALVATEKEELRALSAWRALQKKYPQSHPKERPTPTKAALRQNPRRRRKPMTAPVA